MYQNFLCHDVTLYDNIETILDLFFIVEIVNISLRLTRKDDSDTFYGP